jgi:ferredoxin
MPRITLQPAGWTFTCSEPQTLLQGALAAGLRLPVSCRNGTCRTCRCRVLSGTVVHTIEWPGLLREELAEGWVLPCVAKALDDVTLEAPSATRDAVTQA